MTATLRVFERTCPAAASDPGQRQIERQLTSVIRPGPAVLTPLSTMAGKPIVSYLPRHQAAP